MSLATQEKTPRQDVSHGKRLPRYFTPVAIALAAAAAMVVLNGWGTEGITPTATAVLTIVFYLVLSTIISFAVEGRRYATDRMVSGLIVTAFIIAVAPLISLIWMVISNGYSELTWEFLTNDRNGLTLADHATGAGHALVGTLLITGTTALIAVPLGVMTAVYLVEYGRGPLARTVTFLVDIMTGIPSIVAGLFAAAMIPTIAEYFVGSSAALQMKTGFMGSVALVVLMTPIVIRNTEEMLRIVPNELREASYALGVTKSRTITKVVLRTALPGIVSGVVIAVARIIGETAPLLITTGTTNVFNWNLFTGYMETLPTYVYSSWSNQATRELAWSGALTLILLVLLLNLVARIIAKAFAPKGEK
ncbi:phosphate ABC transporter permease PstA [Flaviflexus equikiangi]|nr:phosphate ABC transporter permease PstA [Flaviflexus equikiangi]